MKLFRLLSLVLALAALPAASLHAQKAALAVEAIAPTPTLKARFEQAGKGSSLGRVVEALDGQLINSINASRKFDVVAGRDLGEVIKRQERENSGNFDAADPNRAQQFKLKGAKYTLVTTVDDFEDQSQRLVQQLSGTTLTVRTIRLGVVGKIYDTTSGKLLEAVSNVITNQDHKETLNNAANNADPTDALLLTVVKQMTEWIATRTADVVFPAKIIAKTGQQVTINRGEGTGIAVGQIWSVYATGEELKDPDTGEILGREEVKVGQVRVTEVLPKLAKAEVTGEDLGVAKDAVVRRSSAGGTP